MAERKKPEISIVIPVYNEVENVAPLHAELVSVLDVLKRPYEIIFVDDGSTDGTFEELKKLSPATVIGFLRNFGKSQALQAGFDEAQGNYIITLDGDLQDDPHNIPQFLEAGEAGNELVCGWRNKRADAPLKKFTSTVANTVTRVFTGTDVHDMNCCFKLYHRSVAKDLMLYGDMHRYIPSVVAAKGHRVTEIPVTHHPRRFGYSKYGPGRIFNSIFDFLTLLFLRRFTDRPMHFFGLLGGILLLAGFIVLMYLTWIKFAAGVTIGDRPLLLLGVLLMIIGFQSLSLGFLAELIIRNTHRDARTYRIREKIQS